MGLSRIFLFLILTCLYLFVQSAWAQEEAGEKPAQEINITVGKDVIVFDGPLRDDGTVDYLAAFNQKYSEGVTKRNNAFVPLYLIAPRNELFTDAYYVSIDEMLGILPADREGLPEYVDWFEYGQQLGLTRDEWADIFESRVNGPFDDADGKKLASWLDANAGAYAYIIQAVERPRYWVPLANDLEVGGLLIEKPVMHAVANQWFARELRRYMNYLVSLGEIEPAIDALFAIKRLAHLQSQDCMLVSANSAHAIYRTAGVALNDLLDQQCLSPALLKDILRRWRASPPEPAVADKVAVDLRCLIQDSVMQIAAGRNIAQRAIFELGEEVRQERFFYDDAITAENFDLNLSLKLVADYFDEVAPMLREANYADYAKKHAKWEDVCFQAKIYAAKALLHEVNGESIVRPKLPSDKKTAHTTMLVLNVLGDHVPHAALNVEYRWRAKHNALQAAIAVEYYRIKHGNLPESLSALAPDHFDAVPIDPYDDKPLRYKKTDAGFMIYSVGENLKDDNGLDDPREGDVVIEIKPAAA